MAKPSNIFVHQHLQECIYKENGSRSLHFHEMKCHSCMLMGLCILSQETSYKRFYTHDQINVFSALQKCEWKSFKCINRIDFINQRGTAFHFQMMCEAERKHDFLVSQKNNGGSFCSQVGRMTNSYA